MTSATKLCADKNSTNTQDPKGWAEPVAEFLSSMAKALRLRPNPEEKATQIEIQVRPRGSSAVTVDTKAFGKVSGYTM